MALPCGRPRQCPVSILVTPNANISGWPESVEINLRNTPCAGMWSFQRSEEHTSELQSLMRISYAVFCLKKKKKKNKNTSEESAYSIVTASCKENKSNKIKGYRKQRT